jgi:hypothetical protein
VHTTHLQQNPKERHRYKDLGVDGRMMDLKTLDGKLQTGFIWLRTERELWWALVNKVMNLQVS